MVEVCKFLQPREPSGRRRSGGWPAEMRVVARLVAGYGWNVLFCPRSWNFVPVVYTSGKSNRTAPKDSVYSQAGIWSA